MHVNIENSESMLNGFVMESCTTRDTPTLSHTLQR